MKKEIKITVCTPTYNRAYILERPFISLMNQTCKKFKWIIVDDGSIDDTAKIVEDFKKRADFEIEYYKKENGGRHTALNYSYTKINTEYVINLDSDDEYVPEAIEILYNIINEIPKEEYDRFWQISGRCIDSKTKKLVGKKFSEGVNELSGLKQRKVIAKACGEKSNCRKLEILKKYPFPIYDDTKFVVENTIWEKINLKYDTYCTNKVFRLYYQDSADSLANGKMHTKTRNRTYYHYSVFCVNELFSQFFFNKHVRLSLINVSRKAILSGINYSDVMKDLNKWYKKILVTFLSYPLAYLYILLKKENRNNI